MQSEKYSKTWSKPPWKNGAQDERKVRILGQHYALGHQVRVELTTPPLGSILMANVQSIENKIEDVRARLLFKERNMSECCVLCFT